MKITQERLLFWSLLLLEGLLAGFLIFSHAMPRGGDAVHQFALQYFFLNETTAGGEIPQWIPWIMQGMPATWYYSMFTTPFAHLLLQMGALLRGFNFITLYYLIFWVNTLFLVAGTWLLAKRFFPSVWTVFFVTTAVAGSAVWTTQPHFNFYFICCLPLILHLAHAFLETGKWRYLCLAGNLLAFQTIGNAPYVIPYTGWVIFCYFLFYVLFNGGETRAAIRRLQWGWPAAGSLLLAAVSLAAALLLLKTGMGELVSYNFGRQADNSASLEVFLNYGGNQNFSKWWELFLGFSPGVDYTLYIGLFCPILILLGLLFNPRRKLLHLVPLAIVLFALTKKGPLAVFLYHAWPMMKFYRHLGFATAFLKPFLCFLAGLGFELVLARSDSPAPLARVVQDRVVWRTAVIPMASVTSLLFFLAGHTHVASEWIIRLFLETFWQLFGPILNPELLRFLLARTTGVSFCITLLLWLALFPGSLRKSSRARVLGLILCLHLFDLYSYKGMDAILKTVALDEREYQLTEFQPAPFPVRRTVLGPEMSRVKIFFQLPLVGGFQGMLNAFLFFDEPGSSLRSDYWLRPLDQMMKAYSGQPLNDPAPPAGFVRWRGVVFPSKHPAALKAAGVTEEKVQFFSAAHAVESEDAAARLMTDAAYSGDLLFLLPLRKDAAVAPLPPWDPGVSLSSSQRLKIPYKVERFSANCLEMDVDAPNKGGAWIFYSDVWHPGWKAVVNGKQVPVYRANLAYKAVSLEPGFNRVRFVFRLERLTLLYGFFALTAIFWVLFVGYAVVRMEV